MNESDGLVTLTSITADPAVIQDLSLEVVSTLLVELEGLRVHLWRRLLEPPETPPPVGRGSASDQMLSVEQAADLMGVKVRWLYRHADELPFTRRLGTRTLRFSEKGVERWLATR